MTVIDAEHKPEVRIVHLRCKCGYTAAIEEYSVEKKKYIAMCLKCKLQTEHDKPHEQRSSNGV